MKAEPKHCNPNRIAARIRSQAFGLNPNGEAQPTMTDKQNDERRSGEGRGKRVADLNSATLRNFLWMFAGGGAEAVLKIIVLLVLARLLVPSEFGVVSAALTVVALAEVTARIGVAPSIVQVKTLTRDHVATGMAATLASGVLIAGVVFAISEPVAALYRMPRVQPLIEVFSLLFIIKGAGLVGEALLLRGMRFRQLALLQVLSYLFGYAVVAVSMAWLGFGPWSLVAGHLWQATLQSCGYLWLARRELAIGFSWTVFKDMFRFGLGVTLTQIGSFVAQNADYLVVGRWLGEEALGYYSRAYLLLKQASQLVGNAGNHVLFPTLATIQEDRTRLERGFNRAISLVALIHLPLTGLLVVCASEIVHVLMGPQWDPAVLPFRILVIVLFFRTSYRLIGAALRATGRVYVSAVWQWAYAGAVALGAFAGKSFGLGGVAAGVSAAVVFCYFFGLVLFRFSVGVSGGESVRRVVWHGALGLFLAAGLAAFRHILLAYGLHEWLVLALTALLFLAVFLGSFLAFPRLFGPEGELLRGRLLGIRGRMTDR